MKKFISVVLASLLSITSIGVTAASAYAADTDEAELSADFVSQITENGSKIPNTYAKMKNGEDINLGYFGGSVTNGYAPANAYNDAPTQGVNCWRGLSQRWLQAEYGVANGMTFAEKNSNGSVGHAGLGGTGIDLNLFRADRWLGLSSGDPVDLLFIEFSINDSYEGNTYEKSAFFMESCIKMIREKSPTTDIVVMLTTDHGKLTNSNGGTIPHLNAQAHIDVAEYYGIPWFWFGEYMYDFLVSENEALGNGAVLPSSGSELWQTYMADGCHPSPRGYQKYFEFLRDNFLIPNLDDTKGYSTSVVSYTTPATPYNQTEAFKTNNAKYHSGTTSIYYGQRLRSDAYMLSPSEVENFGTSGYGYQIYNPGGSIYASASYMLSSNPGMSFTVKFKSRNAGMFYKGHPDRGLIQYRVDGGDWQYANMYSSGNNQHEYFMFYENKEEEEHTVDVILRRTSNGSELEFRGFFVEGDSTKYGAKLVEGAPNKAPLEENVIVPSVFTPALLNTKIGANEIYNDGSSFDIYHLGITDTDVLRYIPNPDSSDKVASDCYNSNIKAISIPEYKYAVIKYYYELEPGTTEANAVGNRQIIDLRQLANGNPDHIELKSADPIILGGTGAHKAIVDLTAVTPLTGHTGNLHQFHFYPFGGVKGNDLASTELMNIESISFYAEYPYNNEYNIDVAVDETVSGTAKAVSLEDKHILPSAHKYATIKYTASEDATLTLKLKVEEGDTFTVTRAVKAGENETIVSLEKIAASGQMFYYESVELSSDKEVAVDGITFHVQFPDPDAKFEITFDANGGTGDVPAAIKEALGTRVSLPNANMENGSKLFLGWSTEKDGSNIVTEVVMPYEGITLYAAYADAALLTYDLNGGSGSIPSTVKVAVGKETSLMSGTSITNGDKIFLGWGTSKDATEVVDKVTMDADGVTVYAIYKELQTVYVAADGSLTYNGAEQTADYTSMSEAFAALGNNGGHIVFEGVFPGTDTIGVSGAPLYIIEGADGDTAGLTFTGYTVNFRCNTTLKNVAFIRKSEDPYFYANGFTLVFGDGFGIYTYNESAANMRGSAATLKGALRGGKAIMHDGTLDTFFTGGQYNGNSSGNIYMEFNGGTTYGFTMGSYYFTQYPASSFTHTGNATVVVNGGTFKNKKITVDHNSQFPTTVTGATSVILNNGITGFTFDTKVKYIIQSAAGGKVSLAADGTSQYAPTFFIKANNPEAVILINGEEIPAENGEYLFMPKGVGTYNITYKASSKAYANADGSGKLTVDGVEHAAYDTILEAMATLDSTGGTVYFSGTHADMTTIIAKTEGMESITFRGVDGNSRIEFPKNVNLLADTAFENMNFIKTVDGAASPYIYANGHKLTIGKLGDAVQPARLNTDSSVTGVETLGVAGKASEFVINGGTFANLGLIDWAAATHNKDVILTINGGTINPSIIKTNYTGIFNVNANLIFTINGGNFHTSTTIDPKANVSGNSIIIFNNDYADKLSTTAFKYVIDAPVGIKVEATSLGNASTAPTFTLTPEDGIEKVFVNRGEIAAKDGVYTFTPTTTGTFIVEADLSLPAAIFVKGEDETGNAPAPITGEPNATVIIPTCTLAKENKRLAGWSTQQNAVSPEFTSTFIMPEGGITLYPVWRDANEIFVASSGKLTYKGVEYVADYTDLATALTEKGSTVTRFVFEGSYPIGTVFDKTVAGTSVTLEGVSDKSVLYAEGASAVNAYIRADHITLDNVRILKRKSGAEAFADFYVNGGNHGLTLVNGTGIYRESDEDFAIGEETADIKSYELSKFIFHSGKAASQNHMGGYGNKNTSGNKYVEIDGTATPASAIQLGGLAWSATTFTHSGNITVVINGGNLAASHTIKVDADTTKNIITNVTGAISVIINNGLSEKTSFSFDPKVEYILKSANGGTVSLKTEGSETTAPTFLIETSDKYYILIDGDQVSDSGSYEFTPDAKGTFNITYEKKPVSVDVEFTVELSGKSANGVGTLVDNGTGFDGRAVLEIEGIDPIYLEQSGDNEDTLSFTAPFGIGEYSFTIRKNGYIPFSGTFTIDEDGALMMPEIPTLIAGDIKGSFDATQGDGVVNIDDFIRVLRGFNNLGDDNKLLRQIVDLNEDGAVSVSDLAVIKESYGKSAESYKEAE